jgi:putative FmdB family regulatory protein
MPKYDYDCPRCGSFSDYRPMAEYELPAICPGCGATSPRAALSLPMISTGAATKTSRDLALKSRLASSSGHGPGCGCCRGKEIPRAEWVGKLL